MGSPVRFIVEAEPYLEIAIGFTPSFELAGADLPKELPTGTKLRKTVTRYAGTYTSVQVHGVEFKPIKLEGKFDDTWTEQGHALEMRDIIQAIVELGEIVRLEYEETELWGTLDADFTERDQHRIEYEITFEPQWKENPTAKRYIALVEPPNDLAESLSARLADTESFLNNPPNGLDLSFVSTLILEAASARNQVGNVLRYLSDVAAYAELTEQQVGLVTRSLFSGIRTLNSTTDRLRSAGEGLFEDNAAAYLRGGEWIYTASQKVSRTLEDLVLMLRKFLEVRRPKRQRTHTVRENDTLQRLARLYLGDYARWTEIADANDLDSPLLTVGDELKIPRR